MLIAWIGIGYLVALILKKDIDGYEVSEQKLATFQNKYALSSFGLVLSQSIFFQELYKEIGTRNKILMC